MDNQVNDADSRFSSYRERVIEHLFVGDLLKHFWLVGEHQVEVLRAEVDGAGYDLVVDHGGLVRHIQLKSSTRGAKRANVDVQVNLCKKPSACIIWIRFDAKTLELGPFLCYGSRVGEFKPAKHTRANKESVKAQRPGLRLVPKSHFKTMDTIADVADFLFKREELS